MKGPIRPPECGYARGARADGAVVVGPGPAGSER